MVREKCLCQFARSVLSVALFLWASLAQADQAQYFYDELGRLVAVVDGQGNAAVYNYDEVGNLLSIQRFTTIYCFGNRRGFLPAEGGWGRKRQPRARVSAGVPAGIGAPSR